jgi:hypothetical protein
MPDVEPPARRDQERWTAYEDLRFLQRSTREERFFDVGYEMGRLEGRTAWREAARAPGVRALKRSIQRAVTTSAASRADALAALLDAARALVLGRTAKR